MSCINKMIEYAWIKIHNCLVTMHFFACKHQHRCFFFIIGLKISIKICRSWVGLHPESSNNATSERKATLEHSVITSAPLLPSAGHMWCNRKRFPEGVGCLRGRQQTRMWQWLIRLFLLLSDVQKTRLSTNEPYGGKLRTYERNWSP